MCGTFQKDAGASSATSDSRWGFSCFCRDAADFHFYRLAFALTALRKPCCQSIGVAIGLDAKAGFDAAIGNGEHIIKFGGVGEISHAETIEPIERTRLAISGDDDFNGKFLRVHSASITSRVAQFRGGRRCTRREIERNTWAKTGAGCCLMGTSAGPRALHHGNPLP